MAAKILPDSCQMAADLWVFGVSPIVRNHWQDRKRETKRDRDTVLGHCLSFPIFPTFRLTLPIILQ
jgi:hypothetical protein